VRARWARSWGWEYSDNRSCKRPHKYFLPPTPSSLLFFSTSSASGYQLGNRGIIIVMGKLYPSCIASNSNSIWFIANAYPTDVPAGYSHFVLVRSPRFPTDTDTDQWTIMGTVPHLELKPFTKPASYSRSLFEMTTCTVDDNGVFAISTGYDDDIMRIVRFDPKSSGAWSVLESVSIGRPFQEFHLFLTSTTASSSSTLFYIYPQSSEQAAPLAINSPTNETDIPTTIESSSTLTPTASPTDSPIPSPEQNAIKNNITPIAIRVGQTQVKGSSAFNCRTITLVGFYRTKHADAQSSKRTIADYLQLSY